MILTNSGVLKLMQRIKSFITSQLNTKANSVHTHTLSEIDDLSSLQMGGGYSKSEVDTLLNGKANSSHTHTKSQITDFPTIPTVNNATLTIQKNGTDVQTFTANQSSDVTCNITVPTKVSDLTNDSGFITSDSTKIPLSGTTALTGDIVPSTNSTLKLGGSNKIFSHFYCNAIMANTLWAFNTSSPIGLYGAPAAANGAMILIYGKDHTSHPGSIRIIANNGTTSKELKAYTNGTLSWNGSAITYTSDSRIKDEIESISDEVLDAWESLEPKQYKLKSELETYKENAQIHYGWIAQDVESVIKGDRKTEVQNGLFTHEFWDEQEEVSHEEEYQEEVQTKDGNTETVTKTRKVIDEPYKAKGDSYSLRYTECLVVECAYLRRENKRLNDRLTTLEELFKQYIAK